MSHILRTSTEHKTTLLADSLAAHTTLNTFLFIYTLKQQHIVYTINNNKTYQPYFFVPKAGHTSQQACTHAGLINDMVRTRHHNIIKMVSLVYGIPRLLVDPNCISFPIII